MHYRSSIAWILSMLTIGTALAIPPRQATLTAGGSDPTHVIVWREPGRCYNDRTAAERYIAATIWDPGL